MKIYYLIPYSLAKEGEKTWNKHQNPKTAIWLLKSKILGLDAALDAAKTNFARKYHKNKELKNIFEVLIFSSYSTITYKL